MLPSIDARLNLRIAKKRLLAPDGPFKLTPAQIRNRVICSQSFLRLEATLQRNVTDYKFPVTITQQHTNGTPVSITEQRLQLQDSFFASHIGYFLVVDRTADLNTGFKNTLLTYPTGRNQAFNNSYITGPLRLLWDGKLQLTVMNRVQCPAWDTFRHLYVPETQSPYYQGVPPSGVIASDEQDGSMDGFYPIEPLWTLIGSKNNDLTLSLPENPGASIEAGGSGAFTGNYKLVIILRGVLAQNSTDVGNV